MTRGHEGARSGPILDAGLQPERTNLAWRRSVLALTVGGVVSLRVLPPALGGWGLALSIAGTVSALLLAVAATRRASRVASGLQAEGQLPPGGALLAAVAAVVALGAVAGLAAVIALAAHRP